MGSSTSNDKEVTAQELANASGETYHTIGHWSDKGLLVFRREGRKRFYPLGASLTMIEEIRYLQNKGYSLDSIRDTRKPNGRGT